MFHLFRPLPSLTLLLFGGGAFAQDFVLSTPGTASWESVATPEGTRTVFTINDNSVFDWDRLVLRPGSEMIFHFEGGDTVTHFLNGTRTNFIEGSVTANGNLGFFSPNADLVVTGSVTAESVTLATLNVDASEFASGAGFSMWAGSGAALRVRGSIEATAGDVILAGEAVHVRQGAVINASERVLMAGGSDIEILADGDRGLLRNSLSGVITHDGSTRAPNIEASAGTDLTNNGLLGEGDARVFLEVGESGRISNQPQGIIAPNRIFQGEFDEEGTLILLKEGDAAPVISDASLKIPALKRPGGEAVSERRRITHSSPVSASADAIRDRRPKDTKTVRTERSRTLASRSSFFGMRGGSADKR